MMNTEFLHPEQSFKLVYGSEHSIWENAPLDPSVTADNIKDGIWLTLQDDGTYKVANDSPNAYPILERVQQYDNMAAGSVTVVKGSGWYGITKRFNYADLGVDYPAAPAQGQLLKAVNGVLQPVKTDGSENHLATAKIERVVSATVLLVQKI